MDLAPARPGLPIARGAASLPLPRTRPDWPGLATPRAPAPDRTDVARQFETLIATTLLRSARAASLGDDGLGTGGDHVRDLVDRTRAEAIARAAPLGIARLLNPASPPSNPDRIR